MLLKLEVAAMCKLYQMKQAVRDFFIDEQGDTNFISVIIILCIVCALAVVFRKNIATLVNAIWKTIFKDAQTATGGSSSGVSTFQ